MSGENIMCDRCKDKYEKSLGIWQNPTDSSKVIKKVPVNVFTLNLLL